MGNMRIATFVNEIRIRTYLKSSTDGSDDLPATTMSWGTQLPVDGDFDSAITITRCFAARSVSHGHPPAGGRRSGSYDCLGRLICGVSALTISAQG